MYTILMKDDKSLIATSTATLFQREKLVDKIQFLIPKTYEEFDIQQCQIVLKYVDQGNEAHAEILTMNEDLYKENYVRCVMPVDTNLTRFAGDISVHLSFLYLSTENELHEEVMHSGEIVISISPLSDYYAFISDKSLDVLDQKIFELDAKLKAMELMSDTYQNEKADGLVYDEESNTLQLTSNEEPIGNPVVIECDATKIEEEGIPVVTFDNETEEENPDGEVDNVVEF